MTRRLKIIFAMRMSLVEKIKKLHWMDYVLSLALVLFVVFIIFRIQTVLNYRWNWEIIPNYIFRWDPKVQNWIGNLLWQGLLTTVRISIYASILAFVFGTILGIARCSENILASMLARTYLELLRNIPPVVVIFIFYFFLSEPLIDFLSLDRWARDVARSGNDQVWGFFFGDMRRFPSLVSGALVLALFEAAFVGEIVRSGIQSIPHGQREAARSIGMNRFQEMRHIILPQAFRKIIPPMANQFIALVKDSSIVSLISVQDLTYKTLELVTSTRAIFESWLTTALFYFIICFSLSRLFASFEKKLNQSLKNDQSFKSGLPSKQFFKIGHLRKLA